MITELKPCPFCGGKVIYTALQPSLNYKFMFKCCNRECEMETVFSGVREKYAVELWNTRTNPDNTDEKES